MEINDSPWQPLKKGTTLKEKEEEDVTVLTWSDQ